MNDEDAGIFPKKRGPYKKRGGPPRIDGNAIESAYWHSLLGAFADELIEEAHCDLEREKQP